eukprot:7034262-Pyramimonas_sp.AAC.1
MKEGGSSAGSGARPRGARRPSRAAVRVGGLPLPTGEAARGLRASRVGGRSVRCEVWVGHLPLLRE